MYITPIPHGDDNGRRAESVGGPYARLLMRACVRASGACSRMVEYVRILATTRTRTRARTRTSSGSHDHMLSLSGPCLPTLPGPEYSLRATSSLPIRESAAQRSVQRSLRPHSSGRRGQTAGGAPDGSLDELCCSPQRQPYQSPRHPADPPHPAPNLVDLTYLHCCE